MKKADVQVGEAYAVKVSGNVVPVVIDEEHPNGGWVGTNQETGRQVRIKSAQRLRGPWDSYREAPPRPTAPAKAEKPEAGGQDTSQEKRATRANTGAQGEKAPMGGLDAAAKVLEEADEPLNCKAIVERAFAAGYWRSEGKTPHATIYSAMLREIQSKGEAARFVKAGRGLFARAQ